MNFLNHSFEKFLFNMTLNLIEISLNFNVIKSKFHFESNFKNSSSSIIFLTYPNRIIGSNSLQIKWLSTNENYLKSDYFQNKTSE